MCLLIIHICTAVYLYMPLILIYPQKCMWMCLLIIHIRTAVYLYMPLNTHVPTEMYAHVLNIHTHTAVVGVTLEYS